MTRTIAALKKGVSASSKNPERDAERYLGNKGYKFPVQIEQLDHPGDSLNRTWHVKAESWVAFLMKHHPRLLAGPGNPSTNFRNFWWGYQQGHPHHAVFDSPLSTKLHRVIPMLLHGDEGRSQKKAKCMVVSLQPALGSTPNPRCQWECDCCHELSKRPDLPSFGASGDSPDVYSLPGDAREGLQAQSTNYRGHSYLTHWLLFSLGSWVYLTEPKILQTLLAIVAESLRKLFWEGIQIGTETYHVAIIGCKGDMDFHRLAFNLTRSYAHVGTIATGKICHACESGGGGPIFEDYGESPAWALRCYESRPWEEIPVLATIPGFPAPEEMLKPDPFHVVKMGIGRNIAGGVLVYLVRRHYFDYAGARMKFECALQRAHGSFKLWAQSEKKYPALRSFTKAFLAMKTLRSAPWTNTKGSDTTLLLSWLCWFISLQLLNPPQDADLGMLKNMLRLCRATLTVFSVLHGHGLWLPRACGRRLYVELMRVLRGYQLLGSRCLGFSYRAFIQKPKNHALHHVAWSVKEQLLTGAALVLNPEVYTCEMDEDYIGRVSRLSRKVDVRTNGERVFRRIFYKFQVLVKRAGKAKPTKRKVLKKRVA